MNETKQNRMKAKAIGADAAAAAVAMKENRSSNASELPPPPKKEILQQAAPNVSQPANLVEMDSWKAESSNDNASQASVPVPKSRTKPASPRYAESTASSKIKRRTSHGKRDRSNSPGIMRYKRSKSITLAQAPMFATDTRLRRASPKLSSTTLELQQISERKKQLEREKKLAKQKIDRVQTEPLRVITKKALTKPRTPKLQVANRPGVFRANQVKAANEELEVKRPTATGPGPLKITHPQPFQLSTAATKHKNDREGKTDFEPIAVKVQKFHNKTPARFRSKRKSSPAKPSSPLQLTEPASVKLATRSRSRNSNVMSREEQEKIFMESLQPFKARPLDQKVLESAGDIGVPKVEKKQPCKPKEFNLRTSQRARRASSPAIGKPRMNSPGGKSNGSRASTRSKNVEPFNLRSQARHEQAQLELERRLKRNAEEEERKRHFKARPLPIFQSQTTRIVSDAPLTEPVTPMALKRSLEAAERRKIELLRKEKEAKKQTEFHAKHLPLSTYEKNFAPKLESTVLVADNVMLHSDVRAASRQNFDAKMKEKLDREEAEKRLLEEQRKVQEAKELREYRKNLGHKALPLPYKSSRVEES